MSAGVRDIAVDVAEIWPDYRPTPLIELPALARAANVARVLVKLENERPLGNFKALGGMVAGLRALARAAGVPKLSDLRDLGGSAGPGNSHEPRDLPTRRRLPPLICASAGNHGLAVAAAAQWAGTDATIYLPETADRVRAARIEALGARIVSVRGTYDDAVHEAARADGLLIADTSPDANDRVVCDVIEGYSLIAHELATQLPEAAPQRPTHLFVQAGVGGLAAALAQGVRPLMQEPRSVVVVEPASAACVRQALAVGRPVRIDGELRTCAPMLACGLASAPALEILRRHDVTTVVVDDTLLQRAEKRLRDSGGPHTTPSGAAGLAGLLHASSRDDRSETYQLGEQSRVLIVVTECRADADYVLL